MTKQLDWRNPDDWGKSPLTDNALRVQQARSEAREQALAQIEVKAKAKKEGENE